MESTGVCWKAGKNDGAKIWNLNDTKSMDNNKNYRNNRGKKRKEKKRK